MKTKDDALREAQAEARRFSLALSRLDRGAQSVLSERLGLSKQAISAMRYGRQRMGRHLETIAEVLKVDPEWLRSGRGHVPEWYLDDGEPEEESRDFPAAAQHWPSVIVQAGPRDMPILGTVAAGDGKAFGIMDGTPQEPYHIKAGRALVRVMGDSAYPVIFSGQYAVVEPERPVRTNNLVVLVLDDGSALVKRWCEAKGAPGGGFYVSVNAGVDSPWIDQSRIRHRWPVVGVLFE